MTTRCWLSRVLGRTDWLESAFQAGLEAYAEESGTPREDEAGTAAAPAGKVDRQRRVPSFA